MVDAAGTWVQLVARWQAHTDTILQLSFVQEPAAFVSVSLDSSMRLWGVDGTHLANLPMGAAAAGASKLPVWQRPFWKFAVDVEGRKAQEAEAARAMIQQINEKGGYEGMHQTMVVSGLLV